MNYYIVVEGNRSEYKIYPSWIKYLNPNLQQVGNISELRSDNYYLISGKGYPFYLQVIDSAIQDMMEYSNIDKLVIAVDSEDDTYEDKLLEINNHISGKIESDKVEIIIQHYCIETWALGNKQAIKRNPQDPKLREYQRFYNVVNEDPAKMDSIDPEIYNRAQFSTDYLKRALRERYRNLIYTKRNPKVVADVRYLERIIQRYETTDHIKSFGKMLSVFKSQ